MGVVIATIIVIVVIAAVIAALIAALIAQDYAILSLAYWQDGGVGTSRSEVVRNLVLGGVAVVALVVGGLRVWTAHRQAKSAQEQATAANEQAAAANEQARISEQGHITDRYAKAVDMLSSTNVRTRTGAVYALARIAQDSVERDHVPVMSVLSEFVCNPPYLKESRGRAAARNRALKGGKLAELKFPPAIQCPDVVAALRSIAERNAAQKAHETSVGFRVNFRRANLQELDLEGAPIIDAVLMEANLTGASLRLADLTGADLRNACLTDADFEGAVLIEANLSHGFGFDGAKFEVTNLAGASLTYTDLTGADLIGADLTGADLTCADLEGVKNLTQRQLDSAVYDPKWPPMLPPGLVHPRPPAAPKAENDEPPPES